MLLTKVKDPLAWAMTGFDPIKFAAFVKNFLRSTQTGIII